MCWWKNVRRNQRACGLEQETSHSSKTIPVVKVLVQFYISQGLSWERKRKGFLNYSLNVLFDFSLFYVSIQQASVRFQSSSLSQYKDHKSYISCFQLRGFHFGTFTVDKSCRQNTRILVTKY